METLGFPGPTTGRDVRVKLAQGLVDAFPQVHGIWSGASEVTVKPCGTDTRYLTQRKEQKR
jgi:hypothetical protein